MCFSSQNHPPYIGIETISPFHPTFAIECHMLHSSADFFSLALCVSEASLLCAEDKTYIIHGAQMRTNLPS